MQRRWLRTACAMALAGTTWVGCGDDARMEMPDAGRADDRVDSGMADNRPDAGMDDRPDAGMDDRPDAWSDDRPDAGMSQPRTPRIHHWFEYHALMSGERRPAQILATTYDPRAPEEAISLVAWPVGSELVASGVARGEDGSEMPVERTVEGSDPDGPIGGRDGVWIGWISQGAELLAILHVLGFDLGTAPGAASCVLDDAGTMSCDAVVPLPEVTGIDGGHLAGALAVSMEKVREAAARGGAVHVRWNPTGDADEDGVDDAIDDIVRMSYRGRLIVVGPATVQGLGPASPPMLVRGVTLFDLFGSGPRVIDEMNAIPEGGAPASGPVCRQHRLYGGTPQWTGIATLARQHRRTIKTKNAEGSFRLRGRAGEVPPGSLFTMEVVEDDIRGARLQVTVHGPNPCDRQALCAVTEGPDGRVYALATPNIEGSDSETEIVLYEVGSELVRRTSIARPGRRTLALAVLAGAHGVDVIVNGEDERGRSILGHAVCGESCRGGPTVIPRFVDLGDGWVIWWLEYVWRSGALPPMAEPPPIVVGLASSRPPRRGIRWLPITTMPTVPVEWPELQGASPWELSFYAREAGDEIDVRFFGTVSGEDVVTDATGFRVIGGGKKQFTGHVTLLR